MLNIFTRQVVANIQEDIEVMLIEGEPIEDIVEELTRRFNISYKMNILSNYLVEIGEEDSCEMEFNFEEKVRECFKYMINEIIKGME